MMNINEVFLYVQMLARKDQRGLLTPDEFNRLAKAAQQKVINRYLPAWPHDSNVENVLRPLVVPTTLTPTVASGLATASLPADYLKYDTITTQSGNAVSIVPNYKYVVMVKSNLKGPSVKHPLGTLYGNVLEVKPLDTGPVNLIYIRKPKDPNWDYNITNGKPVYNATATPGETGRVSQHFELPVETHEEIAVNILHDAGVVLEDALLIQYGLKQSE